MLNNYFNKHRDIVRSGRRDNLVEGKHTSQRLLHGQLRQRHVERAHSPTQHTERCKYNAQDELSLQMQVI